MFFFLFGILPSVTTMTTITAPLSELIRTNRWNDPFMIGDFLRHFHSLHLSYVQKYECRRRNSTIDIYIYICWKATITCLIVHQLVLDWVSLQSSLVVFTTSLPQSQYGYHFNVRGSSSDHGLHPFPHQAMPPPSSPQSPNFLPSFSHPSLSCWRCYNVHT